MLNWCIHFPSIQHPDLRETSITDIKEHAHFCYQEEKRDKITDATERTGR